jgi:VanZ family protein
MGIIALGSTNLLSGDHTGRFFFTLLAHLAPGLDPDTAAAIHYGVRKLGHLGEYGILAILWYRALVPAPRAGLTAFLLAVAYASLDEAWQGLHPNRTPAVHDVAIDAGGALLGLLAWTGAGRWRAATLRSAAWGVWVLAGLAGLLLAVELALGRPAAGPATAAVGLGLVGAGLAHLARRARIRVSSAPRATVPP